LQLLDLPGGVLGIEQHEVVPGLGQDRHVDVRSSGRPDDCSIGMELLRVLPARM
jgi:hypothetical protein